MPIEEMVVGWLLAEFLDHLLRLKFIINYLANIYRVLAIERDCILMQSL